jgi:hypothetical protein
LASILTNSTARLVEAENLLLRYETQAKAWQEAEVQRKTKEEVLRTVLSECSPSFLTITNSGGKVEKLIGFKKVLGASGEMLGTDLIFSSVIGRTVTFREPSGIKRLSFDVDMVHPAILDQVGVDAALQKQRHEQEQQRFRQQMAADYTVALAEQKKWELRRVAEAQARQAQEKQARIDRQQALQNQLQVYQAESDRLRAEAVMKAADAAMERALNPRAVPVLPVVPVVPASSGGVIWSR